MNTNFKKPNNFWPRLFKTFTLYIVATLVVFFGYVYFFGEPRVIDLMPEIGGNADDVGLFSEFLQNVVNTENVDCVLDLDWQNPDSGVNISLQGGVVFDKTTGISLDLLLKYNNQPLNLRATYLAENSSLFVETNQQVYKFNLDFQDESTENLQSALKVNAQNAGNLQKAQSGENAGNWKNVQKAESWKNAQNEKSAENFQSAIKNSATAQVLDEETEEGAQQNFLEALNLDFENVFSVAAQILGVDVNFLDEIQSAIGVDFSNFDVSNLTQSLKIEENSFDDGSVDFNISLGNVKLFLSCDEKYNVKTVSLPQGLKIGGSTLNFSATVSGMNNFDMISKTERPIFVQYDQQNTSIDLSGTADYAKFLAKMLQQNNFVAVDVSVDVSADYMDDVSANFAANFAADGSANFVEGQQGTNIFATIVLDKQNGVQISTKVENVNVQLSILNDKLFLKIGEAKICLQAVDLKNFVQKIDAILQENFDKGVADFVRQLLIKQFPNLANGLQLKDVVDFGFDLLGNKLLGAFLPTYVQQSQNLFVAQFENGGILQFEKQENPSQKMALSYNQNLQNGGALGVYAQFYAAGGGVQIDGREDEYYDLSNLLPLANLAQEIFSQKSAQGAIEIACDTFSANGIYAINFADSTPKIDVRLHALDAEFGIFVDGEDFYLSAGNVVLSGQISKFDQYFQQLLAILGQESGAGQAAGGAAEASGTQQTGSATQAENAFSAQNLQNVLSAVLQTMEKLTLSKTENQDLFVQYLSHNFGLKFEDSVAKLSYQNQNFRANISLMGGGMVGQQPQANDTFDALLQKLESIKQNFFDKPFAFNLNLDVLGCKTTATLQVDAQQNKIEISNLSLGNITLSLTAKDDIIFVDALIKTLQNAQNAQGSQNTPTAQNAQAEKIQSVKFKIEKQKLDVLWQVLSKTLTSSSAQGASQKPQDVWDVLSPLLSEIFEQDVSKLSIWDVLQNTSLQLDHYENGYVFNLKAALSQQKEVSAQLKLQFFGNDLCAICLQVDDLLSVNLQKANYQQTDLYENQYFNLTSACKGTVVLQYRGVQTLQDGTQTPDNLDICAIVEFDLASDVYFHAWAQVLGLDVDVLVTQQGAQLRLADMVFATKFEDAQQALEYVLDLFGISTHQDAQNSQNLQNSAQNSKQNSQKSAQNSDQNLKNSDQIVQNSGENAQNSAKNTLLSQISNFLKQVVGFDAKDLSILVNSSVANATYNLSNNLQLVVSIKDEQKLSQKAQLSTTALDENGVLPKVKALLDYIQNGVFEFNFAATYNANDVTNSHGSLTTTGVLKIFAPLAKGEQNFVEMEISNLNILGEYLNVRLHQGVLYASYAGAKIKIALQNSGTNLTSTLQEVVSKIINQNTLWQSGGVLKSGGAFLQIGGARLGGTSQLGGALNLDFGIYQPLIDLLQDCSLSGIFSKLKLGLTTRMDGAGNLQGFDLALNKGLGIASQQIALVKCDFDDNNLDCIDVGLFNHLISNGNAAMQESALQIVLKVLRTGAQSSQNSQSSQSPQMPQSTITPFDEKEFASFSQNVVQEVLGAYQVQNNVYALSGDVQMRLNDAQLSAKLTVMLVDDGTQNNSNTNSNRNSSAGANSGANAGAQNNTLSLKATVALSTNIAGLDLNVYIIDGTAYIDLAGLQLKASLDSNSIGQMIAALSTDILRTQSSDAVLLETAAQSLQVLMPALDRIYANWASLYKGGKQFAGIEFETDKPLKIDSISLSNIFANVFVDSTTQNGRKSVVPVQISVAADVSGKVAGTDLLANGLANGAAQKSLLKDQSGNVIETSKTANKNFALYVTNFAFGRNVQISKVFVAGSGEDYSNFSSVAAANGGSAKLKDFAEFSTFVDVFTGSVSGILNGENRFEVSGQITSFAENSNLSSFASISQNSAQKSTQYTAQSTAQNIAQITAQNGANIAAQNTAKSVTKISNSILQLSVQDLPAGQTSTVSLLENKSIALQGSIGLQLPNKKTRTLDFLFQSGRQQNGSLIEDGQLFVSYKKTNLNKISAKISQNSALQVVEMLLSLLGTQEQQATSAISSLGGVLSQLENIGRLIQSIKFTNQTDGATLQIVLQKNGQLGTNVAANPTISLHFAYGTSGTKGASSVTGTTSANGATNSTQTAGTTTAKLDKISISNLGISQNVVDLTISLNNSQSKFNYLQKNAQKEHINLDGAEEIFKALDNMKDLSSYHITGNIAMAGGLLGINLSWNIPVDIQIQLDENKKPTVLATIEMPILLGVNNDGPYEFGDTEAGHERIIKIYYKDGFVYFHRTEQVDQYFGISGRTYEKRLKSTLQAVLSDPLPYLQFCAGFSDGIMEQIAETMESFKNHDHNLSKILDAFNVDSHKMNFDVVMDLKELTGDSKMGDLEFGISLVCNSSTNFQKFVGAASFGMKMKYGDLIDISLESRDFEIHFGDKVDVSEAENYVKTHKNDTLEEKFHAFDGRWERMP